MTATTATLPQDHPIYSRLEPLRPQTPPPGHGKGKSYPQGKGKGKGRGIHLGKGYPGTRQYNNNFQQQQHFDDNAHAQDFQRHNSRPSTPDEQINTALHLLQQEAENAQYTPEAQQQLTAAQQQLTAALQQARDTKPPPPQPDPPIITLAEANQTLETAKANLQITRGHLKHWHTTYLQYEKTVQDASTIVNNIKAKEHAEDLAKQNAILAAKEQTEQLIATAKPQVSDEILKQLLTKIDRTDWPEDKRKALETLVATTTFTFTEHTDASSSSAAPTNTTEPAQPLGHNGLATDDSTMTETAQSLESQPLAPLEQPTQAAAPPSEADDLPSLPSLELSAADDDTEHIYQNTQHRAARLTQELAQEVTAILHNSRSRSPSQTSHKTDGSNR